jgi:hypothetical protein
MTNMLVAILVVITDKDTLFKNQLIQSISTSIVKDSLRLYFVYGGTKLHSVCRNGYIDIYTQFPDTFGNIIHKSISGLQVITDNQPVDYIIRTNMSTLFNFEKLLQWLQKCPPSKFFAGPFIAHIESKPMISGTCMVMTTDIAKYIIENKDNIDTKLNEDIGTSRLVNTTPHYTCNIPRIDFSGHNILFHKCEVGDLSPFCYRFKSANRVNDTKLMSRMIDCNYNVVDVLNGSNWTLYSELEIYDSLFSKPFIY